jgi:transcription elongation factor Elf1
MDGHSTELAIRCPTCGHALRRIPFMEYATIIVTRSCAGCGERWSLRATPKKIAQGWAHILDWSGRTWEELGKVEEVE